MPTATTLYLGDARIRAYLGSTLVSDVPAPEPEFAYLGQVGVSVDHDGTHTIELSQPVEVGTTLVVGAVGYTSNSAVYNDPWSATDTAGNTWTYGASAGFSGGLVASLVAHVTAPLGIGDVIALTPPLDTKGQQFSATVDAFTGLDDYEISGTAVQAPAWGYNAVSVGPIASTGFTHVVVLHSNQDRVLTWDSPILSASSAVYTDNDDGRQTWTGYTTQEGSVTATGTFSGSTGWGGAVAVALMPPL